MSQATPVAYVDTESGSQLVVRLNNDGAAMLSSHSGVSRPSYAAAGTVWLDTTTTPWLLKMFDGTDDIEIGPMNAATNTFPLGWRLIESLTAAASATLDFTTGLGATYDAYMLVVTDLRPATDADDLWLRLRDTTFQADAADYEYHTQLLGADVATYSAVNSEGDTKIRLTANVGSASNRGVSGVVSLLNPSAVAASHRVLAQLGWQTNAVTPVLRGSNTIGHYNGAQNPVDGIRLMFSTGNIASGRASLYGMRK